MLDEARHKARVDAVDSEIAKIDLKIREYIRQVKDMDLEILKALDAGAEQIKLEFLLNKQKNLYNRESKARELKVILTQQKLELIRLESAAAVSGPMELQAKVDEVHNMLASLTTGTGNASESVTAAMKAAVSGLEC